MRCKQATTRRMSPLRSSLCAAPLPRTLRRAPGLNARHYRMGGDRFSVRLARREPFGRWNRAIHEQRHHRTGSSEEHPERVIEGDEQHRPQEAGTGCSTGKCQHDGHRQVCSRPDKARTLRSPCGMRGRQPAGRAAARDGRKGRRQRWRNVLGGWWMLPLETLDHIIWIQCHTLGIGSDERAAENPSGPAGYVVGFEPLEQPDGNLGALGYRSEREPTAFALAPEIGAQRSRFVHQLKRIEVCYAGYAGSMR